jgi:hypothetical protein
MDIQTTKSAGLQKQRKKSICVFGAANQPPK